MNVRRHKHVITASHAFALLVTSVFILSITPGGIARAQGGNQPPGAGLAPFLHFTHITSDSGLVQNSIEAILQDRQGFIWIGTQAGLSRFDGYQFTNFQHDFDNPNSLGESHVRSLFEDHDGMIWIGTEGGGVSKFDPVKQTFTNFAPLPGDPTTIGGDRIFTIFQDSDGDFWFGGPPLGGLSRYNPVDGKFTHYRSDGSATEFPFPGGSVGGMLEAERGQLWIIADYLLMNYDMRSQTFTNYKLPNADESRLTALLKDSDGALWMSGSQGLYKFDPVSKTFTYLDDSPHGVNDMARDGDGLFWLATRNGLYRFDPHTGKTVSQIRHNLDASNGLSSDSIQTVYLDHAGRLWVGTAADGLNIYDPGQARFTHYRYDPSNPNGLSKGTVTAVDAVDSGHLWVGVGSTLDHVDLATGQVTAYRPQSAQNTPLNITAVYQDRAGVVWVGVNAQLLLNLDPVTGGFSQYPLKFQTLNGSGPLPQQVGKAPAQQGGAPPGASPGGTPPPPGQIIAFYEDAGNNLWVVNAQGLYRLDPARVDVKFFQAPLGPPPPGVAADKAPLILPPITNLFGDAAGNIWVSTINGFSQLNLNTGKFNRLRIRSGNAGADSAVASLFEDQAGQLWLATEDGLIHFDPATKTPKRFSEKDGLASSFVLGVLGDKSGHLWISTNKGLSRFTVATGAFRNFDVSDGLQANEFQADAFAVAPDGQMFFGGPDGLTAFYPDAIKDSTDQPSVLLTDFQFPEKTSAAETNAPLISPIWATKNLTLNYNQDDFSVEFSALNFTTPEKSRYRYRLDGYESQWTETTGLRRFATYTNLPPGDYTLHVQAANGDGVWGGKEAALPLTILAPWWETTVIRGLAAILLVGLAYGGYKWRIYAIRRRTRELETEVAERTKTLEQRTVQLQTSQEHLSHAKEAAESANRAKSAFLANMSHELRSPLNAILGFAQVINRNPSLPKDVHDDLEIVLRSGEHLLGLINQVLDLSKIEAGHMTLTEVDFDLYRLLDDVDQMFRLKAESKDLQLILDRTRDLPQFLHGDEVKVRQILINLVSNALKFTMEGGVTIRARKVDQAAPDGNSAELQFEVEDTGPGIAPGEIEVLFEAFGQTSSGRQANEGTGLGLPISRRFVRMMGGDITVHSSAGAGATFTFNVRCQLAETGPRQAPRIGRVIGLQPGQPHYRLLVVDDRAANRQLIVKLLQPLGFDMREADNGQIAVEIAHVFEPHLIWMDLRMPIMDGLQATQRIRATNDSTRPVIIALTASAMEEERSTILAAGCDDVLHKPFRTDTIFGALALHLGIRYIFAMDQGQIAMPREQDKLAVEALKAAIQELPAALTERLAEGIELGDIALIGNVIAEIRATHPQLADSLNDMAYQFEYDKILGLLEEKTV